MRTRTPAVVVFLCLLFVGAIAIAGQQDPLADPNRTEADRARDAGSKPLELYEWWGIGAGMTVVDYFPFGGYNSHLLSRVVGPEGRILATRTEFFGDDLKARIDSAGLDNVAMTATLTEIPAGTVDAIVSIRNLHDLYVFLEDEPSDEYAEFLRVLKPGGVVGVVDSRTPEPGADQETHRINQQFVIDELTAAGFEFSGSSEMLADEEDDFGDSRFPVRYVIDRMVLKFTKPR